MTDAKMLLFHLLDLGVRLRGDGDRLKCKAPKNVMTPELRKQLAEHKSEILGLLHEANASSLTSDKGIPRMPGDVDPPLSFTQQRLWFLDQLEGPGPTYNIMPGALRLVGPFQISAMEQALDEIRTRHDTLRTTFASNGNGHPIQVIARPAPQPLKVIDLSSMSETEQMAEVDRLLKEEALRPFDLAKGPLLRTTLLALGKTPEGSPHHILMVCAHHIVCDGWSFYVFLNELSAYYTAFCSQDPWPVPDLPIRYADFAHWQREWLTGEVLERQTQFWQNHLADAAMVLELPTDRPRPAIQTFQGITEPVYLPPEIINDLRTLAQSMDATMFMVLLAAWNVLLSRYAGQEHVIVGTPIANRNRQELEALIGFFANTLALHTDLSGNPTFSELVTRVREVTAEAQNHQDMPFEYLVDALQPERSLSHSPIFQVMFAYESGSPDISNMGDLTVTLIEPETSVAKFDLTLFATDTEEGVVAALEYNTDLFDPETITRMAEHFRVLLEGIAAHPDQPISDLPMLTDQELNQILIQWNNTRADYPREMCIHQLFEAQAGKTPDAVAVAYRDESLSYREVNARANQLAHHLSSLGVGPDVRVGLCVTRSPEMIVGLLGILKAGGAYVPLDPGYPKERLSFMISDTDMPLVLTIQSFADMLGSTSAQRIYLDADWETVAQKPDTNPKCPVTPDHLAYVIYTSGSTGTPKGVMIRHQGLVNYLSWAMREYAVSEGIGAPVHSSLGFDATITSLYSPLLTGGKVVLVPEEEEIETLCAILESENDFSLIKITPAHLEMLGQLADPEKIRGAARAVVIGGEALFSETLSFWQQHSPKTRFINEYGPTETVVGCCVYDAPLPDAASDPGQRSAAVPIGRPIANTQLFILDQHLCPVPAGVPGELYIGGDGVARGYLNRPNLTKERFIEWKFETGNSKLDTRLYKTGDLARYLPDGNIEYLGRTDHQVNLRGFRIELGEIEATLTLYPDVREAAVLVREDSPGQKRLTAYMVLDGEMADAGDIRDFLKKRLPDQMIPSAFVFLDKMPLTINGKVDRDALPAPDSSGIPEEMYVAPRTPAEQILADIWAEVIKTPRVGVNDNFFALGGDSISSIQVVSRAAQAGLLITVRQVFQRQTLAELAEVAEPVGQTLQADQGIVTGRVDLTPIQQWFFEGAGPEPHHYNQSAVLEVSSLVKPEFLETAIHALLNHHDALRMRFVQDETGWKQENKGVSEEIPFTVENLGDFESVSEKLQAGLDLSQGPLMRAAIFLSDTGKPGLLLMVIHHLAVDGVSWRIIAEDMQTIYDQVAQGTPVSLPAKTTSFRQWADQISTYANSETVRGDIAHWISVGRSEAASLPADYPGNADKNTAGSSETIMVSLDIAETRALLGEIHLAYHTQINDVLLTALARVLSRWTGENTVLIDLESHGRQELWEDIDISRTVGWFTSIFPVLLNSAHEELGSDLKSVKEQLRGIPKGGISYGLLRYLSSDPAIRSELASMPQAQILFNYLGQMDSSLSESSLFQISERPGGQDRSPAIPRRHVLEVNGSVIQGCLRFGWTFSKHIHRSATVRRLAREFAEELRAMISHCQSDAAGGYTRSDFPLVSLEQAVLDRLFGNRRDIEEVCPLSPMQQGMFFHTLYEPGSAMYFEQACLSLRGRLNEDAFHQAWAYAAERHPMLRTACVSEGVEEVLQVVFRSAVLPYQSLDWQDVPESELEEKLTAFMHADRERGFELDRPPLIRYALIRLDETRHLFVLSNHHLIMDGWSLPIVFEDVIMAYTALDRGEPIPQVPAPRAYRDYVAWLQEQDEEQAAAFWREQMAGFAAPTPLAVDLPLAQRSESAYDERVVHLPADATAALESLCKEHHLTLNIFAQGAWALLLSQYSRETDLVFGATVSGRPASLTGVEDMVGLFINTLPVRVKLDPDASLIPWLRSLHACQAEQDTFSFSPLVDIQGWTDVPRGVPLFESLMVFENYPMDRSLAQAGSGESSLIIEDVRAMERTNYPITITVAPDEGRLMVKLLFDTGRFDPDVITRMTGHFLTLLTSIAEDPLAKISQTRMLTEQEHHQLVTEWNDTAAPFPQDTIHALFEAQVEKTPEATALVCGGISLTYQELNARANQLAHHLRSSGVTPDIRVGICADRSPELAIGLLGILKAGGAYVPMDPAYPDERIAYMLEAANIRILLTKADLGKVFPGYEVICLDRDWDMISDEDISNPHSAATQENLCYVIFTSGTTGKPKGAGVFHKGFVNLVHWYVSGLGLTNRDHSLPISSLSFDMTQKNFFAPLICGGELHLLPGAYFDPNQIVRAVRDHQITWLNCASSAFYPLADAAEQDEFRDLSSLRYAVVGGETTSMPRLWEWQSSPHTTTKIMNGYGPTECSDKCTFYVAENPGAFLDREMPFGRPISNVRFYVLDPHLRPVPVGVIGEIHIGGVGVGAGYVNDPQLTEEKFVPDPFIDVLDARMYKTGDLARYLPDGNMEYVARIDHQVKFRGFRIELGEIESVLEGHPDVRKAVVLIRPDASGEERLTAYIVTGHESLAAGDLRDFVRQKLPDQMIPSAFVLLDKLPLTPNGKLDRRALPEPEGPVASAEAVLPRDPVEARLAHIWEDALNMRPVGVQDDFFELGGHSLLALRVMTEIKTRFGQALPISALFQGPTIEQLANAIRHHADGETESTLVPIRPNGSKPPFFCVGGAGGYVMYLYHLARHLDSEQPFYALQAAGLDGKSDPHTRIEDMAAHYVEVIQTVQPQGPYVLGGHSLGGKIAFEMGQQLHRQGHEIALIAVFDSLAPLVDETVRFRAYDHAQWVAEVAGIVEEFSGETLGISYASLCGLAPDEQLGCLHDQLLGLNFFPPGADMDQTRGFVNVYKANLRTCYFPEKVHPLPVVLFQPSEHPEQAEDVPEDIEKLREDPSLGWEAFSSKPVMVHKVPGTHRTMLAEPNVRDMAGKLDECILRTRPVECLVLNEADNIGILAISKGKQGQFAEYGILPDSKGTVKLRDNIPRGHKVAIKEIPPNEPVLKFAQPIGYSSRHIHKGEHVHIGNVSFSDSVRFSEDHTHSPCAKDTDLPDTFNGYMRTDGKAGTRNYVIVVSTVNCSATVVKQIADHFRTTDLSAYGVDRVVPVIHQGGCTEAEGSYFHDLLNRTLAGWITNPNVVGAVIVGLGCECTTMDTISEFIPDDAPIRGFIDTFTIQDTGGANKSVNFGIERVKGLLARLPAFTRTKCPLSLLCLGTNCGGSDAFSSLTANPAIGVASDLLIAKGGISVFAETPECFGAEEVLAARCVNAKDGKKLLDIFSWWNDYISKNSVKMNDNISSGNIEGGITTILEKSLGAVAKAGSFPICQVLDYAEPITANGLIFMNTPGFDPVSVTGLAAGGCNLVAFTTGRGSMYGCSVVPTVKISSNSNLFRRFDEIDLDAGEILKTGDVAETGYRIFQKLIDFANGSKTKSEINGSGMEEFVPWQVGAVL